MIKLLRISSPCDFSFDELLELAKKATADIHDKRVFLPVTDAYYGRTVEVLIMDGRECDTLID